MKNMLLLMLTLSLAASANAANEFHPTFPVLDETGGHVLDSGLPMSNMQTCGACHDTAFISDSSDHMAAGVFDGEEIQCLVCHSDFSVPDRWDAALFDDKDKLAAGVMEIHKPRDRNCANCHSVVNNNLDVPLTVSPDPSELSMTDRTGQVIAAQKVVNSGLNIAGKNELNHPFDVHADRVVNCVNCHYSLNNPVYYRQDASSRPSHLDFDPRRLSSADYLERPLHQLAKGSSRDGLGAFESENSMRRCESCHDATAVHQWLPHKRRHFDSLACEACHIPKLYGPAVQALDWTLVDSEGNPRREYRDVDGDPATADSLIHGFRPVMLPRDNVGGERKLAPFNLVSSWYWSAGEAQQRIAAEELLATLYPGGELHSDVAGAAGIDSQREAARSLLEQAGFSNVQMTADITPYAVSHNVVNGRWATRDCRTCHSADSVLAAPFTLADSVPGGVAPVWADNPGVGHGGQVKLAGGGATFLLSTMNEGYYVLGLDGIPLVDLAGLVMFFGILLGVSAHGFLRFIAHRRWGTPERPTERVKLYDAYDRIWHWLQAGAILLLIFTGLIIHKPHIFGMFSFAYVVQVHNVLGFILLINAALALFYTVASGTIKRFFPDPDSFFARTFEQAMFYSRGIFAGEEHPMQKTPQNRLNPLQQVTYLAIINILLPAQVITGFLMWGTQYWPGLTEAVGGLPLLAPLHTFLAWAFAAFIVMHIYLTTTGETPLSGIKSMVTGWEDVEIHGDNESKSEKEASHA
jgi:thiosulfate reductase cytochrome b subunit